MPIAKVSNRVEWAKEELAFVEICKEAGVRFIGFQETGNGDEKLALFNSPRGTTLSLPTGQFTLENIQQAVSENEKLWRPKAGHMAKQKSYLNILDQMLDDGMSNAEMEDSAKRGKKLSDLTQDLAEDGSFTKHVSALHDNARTILAKKLGDDNILNDVVISENKAKSNKDGLASAANEAALMTAIDKLLKIGHSPARIAAVIAKCAELNLDNKQFSTDYLNRRANDLGMSYLQPNTFMPKQPDTYERNKPKMGSTHVAIEGDQEVGFGVSKFGGTATVQRHAIEIKVADRVEGCFGGNDVAPQRVPAKQSAPAGRTAQKIASVRNQEEEFDSSIIAAQHTAGKTFAQIWREACQSVGLHWASKTFHEYVGQAKRNGVKFAAVDADFLRNKLSFRDIETEMIKAGLPPHVAYDSGKQGKTALDGNELMREFELVQPAAVPDVEFHEATPIDVEIGTSEVSL